MFFFYFLLPPLGAHPHYHLLSEHSILNGCHENDQTSMRVTEDIYESRLLSTALPYHFSKSKLLMCGGYEVIAMQQLATRQVMASHQRIQLIDEACYYRHISNASCTWHHSITCAIKSASSDWTYILPEEQRCCKAYMD